MHRYRITTHPPIRNSTVTVVSTAVGSPFSKNGRYRARRIASIAESRSIAGPLTTRKPSIRPSGEIVASTTTAPETCAAFAIAGYTGRIASTSNPAVTPAETRIAFLTGAAATTCVPEVASLTTPGTPDPLMPNPENVPTIPTSGAAPGSSAEIPCGIRPGLSTTRVISGIAAVSVDRETSRATTFGGVTGLAGTNTVGTETRATSRSGCSIGKAITNPAKHPCNPIDPTSSHRVRPAPALATRAATKLSSNICRLPIRSRRSFWGRICEECVRTSIDTAHPHRFPSHQTHRRPTHPRAAAKPVP